MERPGERRQSEQQTRDRAGGRGQGGEQGRREGMASLIAEHRGERQRDAEGEGESPQPDVADGGHGEGHPSPPRATPVAISEQHREQRRRGQCAERSGRADTEPCAQRREQEAVAGQVVAGVPMLIPHGEAVGLEQAHAVDLRSEIRRVRVDEQPQDHEDSRREQRRGRRERLLATAPGRRSQKPTLPMSYRTGWAGLWNVRRDGGVVPLQTGASAESSCPEDRHAARHAKR